MKSKLHKGFQLLKVCYIIRLIFLQLQVAPLKHYNDGLKK